MGFIHIRELLQFPEGDNATDTVINGVHFNRTALDLFNYTIYSNGTISNASSCYLIFDQYQPIMYSNGSWINGTSCYNPYYGIRTRGKLSIAFAAFFAVTIMFTLMNLRKHGRMFLRENKRFRIIGRRWQWYWMTFVASCGLISCVSGIDVDRDYLQSVAVVLQSFFFLLMLPGTLAVVWEATRHWGSWQERQIYDRDPFLLPQNDRRGKTEFWLPLIFYLFAWLNVFMVIPRSWSNLEHQRSPEQQASDAEPSGTDIRLKIGAVFAVCAWLVICFSLHHSLKHYKPRASTLWGKFSNFCHYSPTKLFLSIVILAVRLAYGVLSAWEWDTSLLKYNVNPGWPFALGYGTTLIILIIFEVAGWIEQNEDKILIAQRRDRGHAVDDELGITKKPNWWSKLSGDHRLTDEERLRALTTEVGGGRATARNIAANVELTSFASGQGSAAAAQGIRDRSRSRPRDGADPFRDPSPAVSTATARSDVEGLRPTATEGSDASSTMTGATGMTGRTLTENPPPQRIRSMLDV